MCRIVGVISAEPVKVTHYLINAECSLFNQAVKGKQGDGWGIGWYTGRSLKIFKSEKAVYDEIDVFKRVVEDISSKIVIAHVRKASNPRNLPRKEIIGWENSQPFRYQGRVFAHNGVLRIPDEVAEALGEYRDLIKGKNDSEVYFALLMREWDLMKDVAHALRSLEEALWKALEKSDKEYPSPYSSLNAVFSDGERLYAYNRYSTEKEIVSLKSLCYGDDPYYEMTFLPRDDMLIVASEKLWKSSEWRKLSNGELLTAWIEDAKIRYQVERV